ncbi:hypothetical protein M426DRAFT_17741 [Hypoxylon sp. CI-4A]|nr:hypothetical protein M426DRAFT_17741 [Hypoxylon sp. CI-4A]
MPSALTLDTCEATSSPIDSAREPGKLVPVHLETASRILSIISRYKLAKDTLLAKSNDGVNFLAQIYSRVAANEPLLMCLPAFPFKSPNTSTKVLGRLPDKAEEFGLAHLNGLCASIGDIYAPGASLMIVSDGLVYNDLLGVPDKDVWAYGEALRALKERKGFRNIEFCRLKDIVNIDVPNELDEIRYVANATNFRHALLKQFSRPGYDVSLRISEDEDTCLTYRGYIKFLETDLQNVYPIGEGRSKSKYKRGVEYIAKQMLMRGDAFARAVRERFPDRLRLSIHPSTGENKISVNLLPTDTSFTTPWHCSIAFRLDGTTTTGNRSTFEADDTLELVYEDGRPSYFREKCDLLSWAIEKGGIFCEPLYPAGLLIQPARGRGVLSIRDVDAVKVRALSQFNSPVVLRNFAHTRKRDLFVKKAEELGRPISWDLGHVPKAEETSIQNNAPLRREQIDEDNDRLLMPGPPKFEVFTAIGDSSKHMDATIFSSSTLLFRYLPTRLSLSSFGITSVQNPLPIIKHPVTDRPCLHFRELRQSSDSEIENVNTTTDSTSSPNTDNADIADALSRLLHDRRVAYHHTWEKGDMLVNDSILASHMQNSSSAGCDQALWRIHLD